MNNLFLLLFFMAGFLTLSPNFPPPPGTARIADNMYLDKRPVTYLDYYEFVHHMKISDPGIVDELVPEDTGISYQNEILWNNRKYEDFPIVGLSPGQIQSYCKWRSDIVNMNIEDPAMKSREDQYWKKFEQLDPDKKYSVVYSLPSKEEVEKYRNQFNNQLFDEVLSDGMMKVGTGAKGDFNKSNLYSFRCMATYTLKD